jgi:cell division protein FtsN
MKNRSVGPSLGVLAVLVALPLSGQSPVLQRVEDLARTGRAEEARVELLEWWSGARDNSSARDLQLGLWLRGRLTVDPAQAELDFQRLVVLYPSSPYAPQALLRLAQSRHAQGDGATANRHVATLVRDYPSSQSRTDGEAWLRGAGPLPPQTAGAVSPPATTTAPSPASTAAVTTPPDTAAPFRPARPPAEALVWFVQFGAFADEDRAFNLHNELVDAGLAARLVSVEGSAFMHVRIGRFSTRDEANAQLQQVSARGYTASLVRDERIESMVRR